MNDYNFKIIMSINNMTYKQMIIEFLSLEQKVK